MTGKRLITVNMWRNTQNYQCTHTKLSVYSLDTQEYLLWGVQITLYYCILPCISPCIRFQVQKNFPEKGGGGQLKAQSKKRGPNFDMLN